MSQLVTGRTGDWEIVIGLEVHAQVSSEANYFPEHQLALVRRRMKMCR